MIIIPKNNNSKFVSCFSDKIVKNKTKRKIKNLVNLNLSENNNLNKTKNKFNIIYATDDNYVLLTLVSLVSLMEHSRNSDFYDITILTAPNVTQKSQQILNSVKSKYKNCDVKLINMGEKYKNSPSWVCNSSVATYYRLSVPSILDKENTCLYIDGDTFIFRDIHEIFEIDIKNYYMAGVLDPLGSFSWGKLHYKTLGIKSLENYKMLV